MTYGMILYNTNGKVIANTDDFNYGLVLEDVITCNSAWTNINYIDTGEIPLIFFRFDNLDTPLQRWISIQALNATTCTVGIFGTTHTNGRLSQITGTVYYRIYKTFKSLGDVSGENWGMKIFNSLGEKTFDSRYRVPFITNQVTLPAVGTPSQSFIPTSSVLLPNTVQDPMWLCINPVAGYRGFQYNGSSTALCFGAVGTFSSGGVKYLAGSFGHQPAGGPSTNVSTDGPKQLLIAKNARYYSAFFDGTNDYLTVASNAALSPGSQDFTVEMWIKPTAIPGANSLWDFFHKGRIPTSDYEYAVGINFDANGTGAGYLSLYISTTGTEWIKYDAPNINTFNINTWYHLAVSKVGTTAYYFVNGVARGTMTVPSNIPARGGNLGIANNNIGTNPYFQGYISSLYFLVGSGGSHYTGSFTPRTKPLELVGPPSSYFTMLAFDSSTIKDTGAYNFTLNNPSGVTVSSVNPYE